jgi:hypothetical protein
VTVTVTVAVAVGTDEQNRVCSKVDNNPGMEKEEEEEEKEEARASLYVAAVVNLDRFRPPSQCNSGDM